MHLTISQQWPEWAGPAIEGGVWIALLIGALLLRAFLKPSGPARPWAGVLLLGLFLAALIRLLAGLPAVQRTEGRIDNLQATGLTLLHVTAGVICLFLIYVVLERSLKARVSGQFYLQLVMLLSTPLVLLVALMMAPIPEDKGALFTLVGIVLGAIITLSSTSFVGNTLAGLMLRSVKSFHLGDFLRVGEHFGQVSGRGLFHTEIQNESSELITLPNLFLVTHPVTVLPAKGSFVSADVSLGYDVPRLQVKQLLLEAAGKVAARAAEGQRVTLDKSYVTVVDLGDHAVTYRVAGRMSVDLHKNKEDERPGLLPLSMTSRLRGEVLDALHRSSIEVVSPRFVNVREISRTGVIPPVVAAPAVVEGPAPEVEIFDKAPEALALKELQRRKIKLTEDLEEVEGKLREETEESSRKLLEATKARLSAQVRDCERKVEEAESKDG